MASAESVAMFSGHDDDDDPDSTTDDAFDFHSHPNSHNLSRLSVCTSSLSRLSIESFDDADDDISDENHKPRLPNPNLGSTLDFICSSDDEDSDKEAGGGCYSLPATPPRRRSRGSGMLSGLVQASKEYASENDGVGSKAVSMRQKSRRNPRSRSLIRDGGHFYNGSNGLSGESDYGGGRGMMVITRPKGGRRSLCMDSEEVKACKDLGFELEHERMVELPGRISGTSSASGGDSPISNLRRNSNRKMVFHYGAMQGLVFYKDQQIGSAQLTDAFDQEPKSTMILNKVLSGATLTVTSRRWAEVQGDRSLGKVPFRLDITATIMFKVSTWHSENHRMHANCDVSVGPDGFILPMYRTKRCPVYFT